MAASDRYCGVCGRRLRRRRLLTASVALAGGLLGATVVWLIVAGDGGGDAGGTAGTEAPGVGGPAVSPGGGEPAPPVTTTVATISSTAADTTVAGTSAADTTAAGSPGDAPTSATTTTAGAAAPPDAPWVEAGRRYYFPIQPAEAASYGPDHHDYPATDIFATEGTTVVAVTDGVVDEVGNTDRWDPATNDPATRGGLYVSIVGDDGVRYYSSHLSSVAAGLAAGGRVAGGQVIGAVGRSGNAATTPPHVHFGISPPTRPGDWEVRRGVVSPYEYLRAWAAGRDLAPQLP